MYYQYKKNKRVSIITENKLCIKLHEGKGSNISIYLAFPYITVFSTTNYIFLTSIIQIYTLKHIIMSLEAEPEFDILRRK